MQRITVDEVRQAYAATGLRPGRVWLDLDCGLGMLGAGQFGSPEQIALVAEHGLVDPLTVVLACRGSGRDLQPAEVVLHVGRAILDQVDEFHAPEVYLKVVAELLDVPVDYAVGFSQAYNSGTAALMPPPEDTEVWHQGRMDGLAVSAALGFDSTP